MEAIATREDASYPSLRHLATIPAVPAAAAASSPPTPSHASSKPTREATLDDADDAAAARRDDAAAGRNESPAPPPSPSPTAASLRAIAGLPITPIHGGLRNSSNAAQTSDAESIDAMGSLDPSACLAAAADSSVPNPPSPPSPSEHSAMMRSLRRDASARRYAIAARAYDDGPAPSPPPPASFDSSFKGFNLQTSSYKTPTAAIAPTTSSPESFGEVAR